VGKCVVGHLGTIEIEIGCVLVMLTAREST